MMAYGSYPGGPQDPYRAQPVYVARTEKSYIGPAVLTLLL